MIQLVDVSIRAGDFSLEKISFEVPRGGYAVLMGRTGRGKTTILESICGLRKIKSGQIRIDGQEITNWLPGDRQIGYVPQDLALFPTMTVRQHLAFALRLRNRPNREIDSRIKVLANVLSIDHLLDRGVGALSGGESQRVALGRALSFQPSVLLLDEPLSALDQATRQEMHELLLRVKSTTGVTTLHVTHNQEEADVLADLRLVLENGAIQVLPCHKPERPSTAESES